jgi:hypothetical protein
VRVTLQMAADMAGIAPRARGRADFKGPQGPLKRIRPRAPGADQIGKLLFYLGARPQAGSSRAISCPQRQRLTAQARSPW